MGITLPNDLRIMVVAASGIICERLYGAGMEAAHWEPIAVRPHLVEDWGRSGHALRILRRGYCGGWRLLSRVYPQLIQSIIIWYTFLFHRCWTSSELLWLLCPYYLHRPHLLQNRRSLPLRCQFDLPPLSLPLFVSRPIINDVPSPLGPTIFGLFCFMISMWMFYNVMFNVCFFSQIEGFS